jgi:uncharacterized protein YlzI (FlbEa/FlbD family)
MIELALLNGETIFLNISLIESIIPQVDGATLKLSSGKTFRTFENAVTLNSRIFGYQRRILSDTKHGVLTGDSLVSTRSNSGTIVQLFPQTTP